MFQGSIAALVTPMHNDGSLAKDALCALLDWHIQNGTQGIVIAGTTGESATLELEEKECLIRLAVKHAAKRIPVIAGTGSNNTHATIQSTKLAQKAGADACLIVTPYYNKPTQKGLVAHYEAITKEVDLPIILYNVPSRTNCDLLPDTVEKLSHLSSIIGIKEATGKIERASEIRERCGDHFLIYSGDDETALALIQRGAKGVISVTANVAPKEMQHMCTAALTGNYSLAESINQQLMPLHQKLFLESNPIPVKWALYKMGKISGGIRLPLLPLDEHYHSDLEKAMQIAGVL